MAKIRIGILTIGIWNNGRQHLECKSQNDPKRVRFNSKIQNPNCPNGFTFIELLVVISLISLMLCIAVPRFQDTLLSDNTNKVSRWIMAKVQALKAKAVRDQKRYVLHFSLDFNRMWTTHTLMSEEELQSASQNAYQLPGDLKLQDVEYPGDEIISGGQADINFYKKGYSDMAMIHIEDGNDEQLSFVVEPFLPRVRVHQKYVGFED